MSKIENSIPVRGTITPVDTRDTYPTHEARWGKGGYVSVNNLLEVSEERKEEGMKVYELSSNTEYIYLGGEFINISLNRAPLLIPGYISVPEEKSIFLLKSPNNYILENFYLACLAGTASVSVRLNNAPIPGLTNILVETQGQNNAPANELFITQGDRLDLLITAVTNCEDLEYTISLAAV